MYVSNEYNCRSKSVLMKLDCSKASMWCLIFKLKFQDRWENIRKTTMSASSHWIKTNPMLFYGEVVLGNLIFSLNNLLLLQ